MNENTGKIEKVGIVLSGGGIRLFAHIGMLMALEDAGLSDSEEIGAIVGTSAGAVIAAFFAAGYRPQDIWRLANWRIWDEQNTIPTNPKEWRSYQIKRPAGKLIDPDFKRLRLGITENILLFKGFVRGRTLLGVLQRYLPGPDHKPLPDNIPRLGRTFPLYLIASNLSDQHEAVFHFSQHTQPTDSQKNEGAPVQARMAEETPIAPGQIIVGGGREVQYEYYHDLADTESSAGVRLSMAEGVRCSLSIPGVFRPYYRLLDVFQREKGPDTPMKKVRKFSYYVDGGVRDNYPISIGVKVAGCSHIFGLFLGSDEYPFEEIGSKVPLLIGSRLFNAFMQTIYEADQDDGEIYEHQVRSLIMPPLPQTEGKFDTRNIGEMMETGYIATAHYLSLTSSGEAPLAFLKRLLAGEVKLSWEKVFSIPEKGNPVGGVTKGKGRVLSSAAAEKGNTADTTTIAKDNPLAGAIAAVDSSSGGDTSQGGPYFEPPAESNYYVVQAPGAFYREARDYLARAFPLNSSGEERKKDSTPASGEQIRPSWSGVLLNVLLGNPSPLLMRLSYTPPSNVAEIKMEQERQAEISKRNKEKQEVLPDELLRPPFNNDHIVRTQTNAVKGARIILLLFIFGTLSTIYSFIIVVLGGGGWWILSNFNAYFQKPGFGSALFLFLFSLFLAFSVTGALFKRTVEETWQSIETLIKKQLGI